MQRIRRKNVNMAVESLWSKKNGTKNMKLLEKTENTQCKIMHCYKRIERQCGVSYSKHRVLSEIKSHVNQKTWSKVKNLFLLLLRLNTDIEPLIWRYSFILTLYSNIDNVSNIFEFFKTCTGSIHSNTNLLLKDMLLINHHK